MAARKRAEDAMTEVAPEVVEAAENKEPECVYTAQELVANHKIFGTYREIVEVALRQANKETATFSEAKRIIDAFKKKEVK